MGRIFYLMGKSATGKDTVYRRLREMFPGMGTIVLYTTRPRREGESEGREYHFIDEAGLCGFREAGRVIECRTYQTVAGPWSYATVDDGSFDVDKRDYLVIGTLESYLAVRGYFSAERVIPLYIWTEDGERLTRAVLRERKQKAPRYAELCRRFLADEADFSEEKLREAGITVRFENDSLDRCLSDLAAYIRRASGNC